MLPTNSKRVGYVVKRYPRFSETFIVNEILAHEAAGMEIEILALRAPCDTHFQDQISRVRAPVHYVPGGSVKASTFWNQLKDSGELFPHLWTTLEEFHHEDAATVYQAILLARVVQAKKIDHLHAHFATSAASVARLAARLAEIPYTITAHAKDIFHESVQPDDLSRKLSDAAAVITVSDYNEQYLREMYGSAARNVQRIYNGLSLDEFPFQPPSDRPAMIVSVGRLVEKKGFDDLIEACAILASRNLEFKCQLIGGGDLEESLRAQVERLNLQSRVELLGPRPQSEVRRRIHESAVLAAPCVVGNDGNRDGLPTVLLEAMALGTPCISTGVTGIPEIIHHERTGLLVPQHDPTALADAIERLLADAELRLRLADRARAVIETDFDIHRNSARLRWIFEDVRETTDAAPLEAMLRGTV